tara:strand:- start:342 stop:1190 length:849 start_codon:yes stop_codon:yes gene_type:complete
MSLRGDYDGNGNVSVNDATFILKWLAAGGSSQSTYPKSVSHPDGITYTVTSDTKDLNPTQSGNNPSVNDSTYILKWLAAGGSSKPSYPKSVTHSDGITYTIDYHTRLKWNELVLEYPTSYLYIFVEVYNVPKDQFNLDDGLVVDLNSSTGFNVSGKSDVSFNGFFQEYTGADNVDLINDTTNALYNIKLKTNTLYHKAMAVPIPLDQDILKSIGIYKFEDGHSYGGDTDHNLGKTKNVASSQAIINKDTYIIDNETKKLYRMRNGVGTEIGTIPGSGDVIFT